MNCSSNYLETVFGKGWKAPYHYHHHHRRRYHLLVIVESPHQGWEEFLDIIAHTSLPSYKRNYLTVICTWATVGHGRRAFFIFHYLSTLEIWVGRNGVVRSISYRRLSFHWDFFSWERVCEDWIGLHESGIKEKRSLRGTRDTILYR